MVRVMEEAKLIDANALPRHAAAIEGDGGRVIVVLNSDIAAAPTIDAEPVRHGRWNTPLYSITPFCTECGQTNRLMIRIPKYCPNCGAKMDGGTV